MRQTSLSLPLNFQMVENPTDLKMQNVKANKSSEHCQWFRPKFYNTLRFKKHANKTNIGNPQAKKFKFGNRNSNLCCFDIKFV